MFSSLKQIRFDAGFQVQERQVAVFDVNRDEPVLGDGTTTVFYTKNTPIIDRNGDDTVTTTDVVVYVNGTAVSVSTIDAASGKITLAAAPALNAVVTVSYDWSPVDDTTVETYRKWAYALVISAVARVYVLPVDDATVNPDFDGSSAEDYLTSVEVMLAAGKLLQIVYTEENDGFNKQGQDKVTMGRQMLKDLMNNNIQLFDTESLELQRKATHDPVGFPNVSDSSSQVRDDGYKFPVNKDL